MSLTWHQRLHLNPHLADITEWPTVIDDDFSAPKRKIFRRNYRIAAAILNGLSIAEVAAQERLSRSRITQVMNRCLGSDANEAPPLAYGLIPYSTTRTRQRCKSLGRVGDRHVGGYSCAFRGLLQAVPGLSLGLDAMLEEKLRDSPHAQRISPRDAHAEFKRLLSEANWPRDAYPYTTDSLAYESVRRYVHLRTQQIRCEHHRRSVQRCKDPGLGIRAEYRAFERIQIDEHRLDIETRLHLDIDGLRIPLRLGRASVLLAMDVFSGCCLGVQLALTKAPDQDALLGLLTRCLTNEPMLAITTPGLKLSPGAGFPAQINGMGPISLGIVEMDNAWMHRADSVAVLLCDEHGATIHQSRSRNPLGRALVESIFGYLATHVTHRFSATSGTGPQDPRRESPRNRKCPPTCSLRTLEEALTLVMAEHNALPQADRGGLTPLELIRMASQQQCLRYRSDTERTRWKPFEHQTKVRIHRPADEHHRAHINFAYCRYTNHAVLDGIPDVHVNLHYDRRDIRTVQAFSLSGKYLGVLHAPPTWARYAHGLMLRLKVVRKCRKQRTHTDDPLSTYFRELLDHKDNPEFSLEMLRVAREINPGQTVVLAATDTQEAASAAPTSSRAKLRERYAALVQGGPSLDYTS